MTTNHEPALATNVFSQLDPARDLRGASVYLEPLDEKYRAVLRELVRDERIWEFTKTILLNESYDQQFDNYFNQALRLREKGGLSFIIRGSKEDIVAGSPNERPAIGEEGSTTGIGEPVAERKRSANDITEPAAEITGSTIGQEEPALRITGSTTGIGEPVVEKKGSANDMTEPAIETTGSIVGKEKPVVGLTGPIIGMTRLYYVELEFKRLEIGYTWYIPSVWGKVHNKECKLLLLQYAFETLGFNRVGFRVAHQNIRSQKAVTKIGGVKEGVLRKNGIRGDGSSSDTVLFSIINDEWPEKKARLKAMLLSYDVDNTSR